MSLIIIAFKTAPTPSPDRKAKDEALDEQIRKKTMGKIFRERTYGQMFLFWAFLEIYNRSPNKDNLDANTIWQQVVTSLSEQASIRESLPIAGGFISK